jgi:ABC transport system ATP-binding/permease protein
MALVSLTGISLEIGDQALLRHADLTIEPGERLALIGRNGAGKSTLLRIIEGELTPDSGDVVRAPGLRVGRLPQALPDPSEETVREFVASGVSHLQVLIDRYHHRTVEVMDEAALKELEALQHQIESESGWNLDQRVSSLLTEMELRPERPMKELSGGWRRRAALARAWVGRPELLLLDEPTNHLDLSTIEWLEERLRGFSGAILFVTHDRAFLGKLATRILELDRAELTSWPGDYALFLRKKEESLATERREAALFDKRLAQEEAWIRQGVKARRTRNEGRVKALEKMREEYTTRVDPEGKARIQIDRGESSGKRVIELEEVTHGFGGAVLFDGLSLKLLRGDRLGIVGNNGVGKTTLLRIMLGELGPDRGTVQLGVNLQIAYFDQLRRDFDPTKTAAETVSDGSDHVRVNGSDRHVLGYLKDFSFSAERAVTRVGALSGGERNRILLARLFARPSNLLVLDEPTNDLDLETLEVLEEQLLDYQGTLLLISHDRAFLDNVVTSTLVFEDGGAVNRYPGGFSDWARKGRSLSVKDRLDGAAAPVKPEAPPPSGSRPRERAAKLSYKLQLELDALPARIEDLEKRLASLTARAEAPEFYAQPFDAVEPVLNELASTREELEAALERWMELEEMQSQSS